MVTTMAIKPSVESYALIDGRQNPRGKSASVLVLKASHLRRLSELQVIFTPTIQEPDEESTRTGPSAYRRLGYQRPADATRVSKIGKFYRTDDILGFTTPLAVAVRRGISIASVQQLVPRALSEDPSAISELHHALAIIDGQHRALGAMSASSDDFDLFVIVLLIHGLAYPEETTAFDVINTTPKRLPKALVEWNRFGITDAGQSTYEHDLREIAVTLATDPASVWYEQVNLTATGREPGRKVTLEGLRRSTENMLKAGGLRHLKFERQMQLVRDYWAAIANVFSDAWNDDQPLVEAPDGSLHEAGSNVEIDGRTTRLPRYEYRIKELVGVASLAKLGGDILAEALGNANPTEYIREEVEKIAAVNWRKNDPDNRWMRSQAGFAGQKELYDALAYLRARGVPPWEDNTES
jgi:DGQHR domain-containing protein